MMVFFAATMSAPLMSSSVTPSSSSCFVLSEASLISSDAKQARVSCRRPVALASSFTWGNVRCVFVWQLD